MTIGLAQKVERLQEPILILGGSGFVGANLLKTLLRFKDDVIGTAGGSLAWRLQGLPSKNVIVVDLLADSNLDSLLNKVRPQTIFNCVAYGAYSFETNSKLIYQTNFNFTAKLLNRLQSTKSSLLPFTTHSPH